MHTLLHTVQMHLIVCPSPPWDGRFSYCLRIHGGLLIKLELSVAFIIFALRLDDACKCHTYYDNSCSSNASWR